jgi:5-methylcytosine-specific restriction endonuclease McrA
MNPQPKSKIIRLSRYKLKKLQKEVLIRDNFTCQHCGCFTEGPPHHKIKLSQGGSDTAENLEAICLECHAKEH